MCPVSQLTFSVGGVMADSPTAMGRRSPCGYDETMMCMRAIGASQFG
jgi:hypothetical protein